MKKPTLVIASALAVALAFGGGAYYYKAQQAQDISKLAGADESVFVRAASPSMGAESAKVQLVEFFDPACEACRAFYPHVKQILTSYPRHVRLVIRYVPFHKEPSVAGVQILEAARRQQRFDPVMDALMQSQPIWASHSSPAAERAWEFASAAGLDLEQARAYVATGVVDKLLEQDIADLNAVGVRATPTFFINGRQLPEPDPSVLLAMVKSEVERLRKAP